MRSLLPILDSERLDSRSSNALSNGSSRGDCLFHHLSTDYCCTEVSWMNRINSLSALKQFPRTAFDIIKWSTYAPGLWSHWAMTGSRCGEAEYSIFRRHDFIMFSRLTTFRLPAYSLSFLQDRRSDLRPLINFTWPIHSQKVSSVWCKMTFPPRWPRSLHAT